MEDTSADSFRIARHRPRVDAKCGHYFLKARSSGFRTYAVKTCLFSSAARECSAEHGPLADRLFFRRFILNDIPMLDKDSVLNVHNVRGNPIYRSAETAKPSVHDHKVTLSHDCSRFVLQRWRKALDEIEQTLTTSCDMSAVLNVVRRPELFCGRIITLVEECVERFQDKGLVLFGRSLRHVDSFLSLGVLTELMTEHSCGLSVTKPTCRATRKHALGDDFDCINP